MALNILNILSGQKPFLDYNQIQSGLYLGNINAAKNEELINKLKIKAILTVDIYPLPDEIVKQLTHYLHIKLQDDEKEDLISNLPTTCAFINKCLNNKINLLIHCVAGISRSSSVVIGHLMKSKELSFEQAFEIVRKKRSKICCNEGFKRQLKLWYEMNWSLNPNYRPYRQHGLSILSTTVNYHLLNITRPNSMRNLKEAINNYLIKFHDKKLNPGKVVFKCKKCRQNLFNEINVLTNTTSNNSRDIYNNIINTSCGSIYVEPSKCWMFDEISSLSGLLNCSNCFSRLGKFNWLGIECSPDCTKHLKLIPSFKIDAKKVDHQTL